MTKRYSYLDSLNAGRERRPERSYDDLNRALDSLESTFESLAGRRGGSDARHGDADRWRNEKRERDSWRDAQAPERRPGFDLSSLARDIDRSRAQEDSLASITRIAADLTALRRDLRGEMTQALGGQFDALRRDIEALYRSALNGRSDPAISEELQRISSAIAHLAEQRDDRTLNALLGEMDGLKRAVSELTHDETLRNLARRWDEFGDRFDGVERRLNDLSGSPAIGELDDRLAAIADSIARLPDNLPLRSLDEKIRTLAGAIDHFSRSQNNPSPRSIEAIEERLDEIARAIVATSSAGASQFSPEPFERIEARISSLARQIDEYAAARQDSDAPQAFAMLADRIDRMSEHSALPQKAIERLTDQIGRIGHLLDEASGGGNADALRAFEQRFETLAEALQQQQENTARQGVGHIRAIEQRLEEMIERIETSAPGRGGEAQSAGIENRLAELAQRMNDLDRGVNPDAMKALVTRLDDISGRLDHARGPAHAIDPDLVRNLETQVAGLSALLSRPDQAGALPEEVAIRLDRMESAVAISRESVLDAARLAAEEAIRIAPGNPNGPAILALADDLKTLDALARRSDERNAKTFEAIHETLLKIVDRLVMLESSKSAGPPETKIAIENSPPLDHNPVAEDLPPQRPSERQATRTARTPAEAASEAAFAAIDGNARQRVSAGDEPKKSLLGGIAKALSSVKKPKPGSVAKAAPAPAAAPAGEDTVEIDPALANKPIEPGSGAPDLNAIMRRVREEQRAPGGGDAGQSDFIAAARRHAQAAAAEADSLRKKAALPKAKTSGLLDLVAQKRKPILMAIGAIVIALSGLQLGKMLLSDGARTEVAQTQAQPAPPASSAETRMAQPVVTDGPAAKANDGGDEVRQAVAAPASPASPAAPETAAIGGGANPTPVVANAPAESTLPAGEPAAVDAFAPPAEAGPLALVEAAKGGDAAALYEIANRYAEGRNGTADPAAAATWYEKAADLGLAPAQYRIGNLYEKGTGVARDISKAKTWYQMAAEQGNASAMHNLAVLFATGADGAADNESAARWFLSAAELGVKDSQYNLGILAAKGIGTAQNLEESYKWFALAAKSGDKDAAAKRDEVAKALRPDQLEKARGATELWQPKALDAKANAVDIPAAWNGGEGETASVDMKKAIKNIQLILNKNGYDAGAADGVMGAKTKLAIAAYQKANGMTETGEVDEALVRSLLAKK